MLIMLLQIISIQFCLSKIFYGITCPMPMSHWDIINTFIIPDVYCWYTGGIGEAVAACVSGERDMIVKRLAVDRIPRSGKPDELLDLYHISAKHIEAAVKELIRL